MKPIRVHVAKKFKNEAERKRYEAEQRVKEMLRQKNFSRITRAEKDELLLELARMHDLIE